MKIECPNCGNSNLSDMEWCEMVPSCRKILGMIPPSKKGENPWLAIDMESEEFFEGSDGGGLVCANCDWKIKIPNDLKIDFMEESDYEAVLRLREKENEQ